MGAHALSVDEFTGAPTTSCRSVRRQPKNAGAPISH